MSKNSNGLGSITYVLRNGKKYWTGRVTLGFDANGEIIRPSFSGYKKSEVIEKMRAAKNAADSNISGLVNRGDAKLGDFVYYWIFEVKAKEVKGGTIDKYNTDYNLRLAPFYFSKVKVKDVTILNLQKFIDFLSKQEGISYNMLKSILSVIKLALEHAIILGMLSSNPASYPLS